VTRVSKSRQMSNATALHYADHPGHVCYSPS